MPSSGPVSAGRGEGLIDLLFDVGVHLADQVHHRAGGHRRALGDAVQLALELRITRPIALAAPVEVGTRLTAAARARRRSCAARPEGSRRRVGVDRGHDPALDPDRVVQHLGHRRERVVVQRRRGSPGVCGSLASSLTPRASFTSGSLGRAEIITLVAPPPRAWRRLAAGEQPDRLDHDLGPVSPQGGAAGSRSLNLHVARRRRPPARSRCSRSPRGTGPGSSRTSSRCASVSLSVMCDAHPVMSAARACAALKTFRPMRPKPLMPAFKAMSSPSFPSSSDG